MRRRFPLFLLCALVRLGYALPLPGLTGAEERPAQPLPPGKAPPPAPAQAQTPRYEFRAEHDPDGLGKFYLGREIARTMSHLGADWLERPERQQEERPDLLIDALKLKAGDAVADIGAGSGYLTRRLAKAVGSRGTVYATDIQPEMLDRLRASLHSEGITNVTTVLGGETDPRLPAETLDLAILVDVYHEFSHPYEMLAGVCRALKPGGRLVFVEYRAEDPTVPIKPLHKMTEAQVRREAAVHPLRWVETLDVLPRQHLIVFRKLAVD